MIPVILPDQLLLSQGIVSDNESMFLSVARCMLTNVRYSNGVYFSLVAPWIDKAALKDLRVRAGKPIQYKIAIRGEPMPIVGWTVSNANAAEDSRVEIKTYPTETTFELRSSLRADTGKYTVTLSNDSGTTTASAFVTVLGMLSFVPCH